ncbi:uncharacterized protein [Dermacentor andersoni]|uniref:uncharacterized protein isoform X1 n=1 Tax=Dermacentor andersoni TaxID=34620 RepID=UPI003B3B0EF1
MATLRGQRACAAGSGCRWTWHGAPFPAVLELLLLLPMLLEPVSLVDAPRTVPKTTDDGSPTALPPCDVDGVASRDVTLKNGSEFQMTCTLTRWPSEQKFQMGILRSRNHLVPKSETRLNNATSVTWTRRHVTDADAGTYYCIVRGGACESVYNATGLVVGYFPQMPPAPTCSGDKFETFQCTWETPDNRVETRYAVSLRVGPTTVFSRIECNKTVGIEPRNLTCQLKTSGRLIYRIEEEVLRFEVVGSNMFGAKQWEYVVDHFANVVLEPPKRVYCNAMAFNASVNWTSLPRISTFPDVVYEVSVKQDNGEDILISVQNRHATTVEELIPNTRYEFSVRVKFAKATDKVWSPFSHSRYCKTDKARPTVLPKVADNSFIIQDLEDRRKVRLYYQRVPKFLWNGDHMSYVLHWCSSSGDCGSHRVSGERSYADLFNLSRVESYTFHLYSENELGRSHVGVRVLVPSADLLLPPVQHAYISEGRDSASRFSLAKWEKRWSDQVHHYTLFWCSQDGKDAESCAGDVSWATVKSAGDVMTAVGCAFAGMCRYGVATRSARAVSPMVWIDCIVPRSKEYQNLFEGRDAVHYDEITDTAVQLAFLTKCSGLVSRRVVRVCAIQGQDEPERNETSLEGAADTSLHNGSDADLTQCFDHAVGPEKAVRLSDLEPATTYHASVRTVLEDGATVHHRPLIFKTQAKSSSFIGTPFIVLYIALVVVAVVAVLSWKRVSDYISMYKNTPIKVLIPADFVKEPIKKSESVRSNLREYVLGSKDSPYGLPQIALSEAQKVEDISQCPELGRLFGELYQCDGNEADAAETRSMPDKGFSTNPPAAGYSLVSTTQDDPRPDSNDAYSKFSTFQDAPEELPTLSLSPNYSRLSSMFLGGFGAQSGGAAPSVAEKKGYSKFAAFLGKPSAGDESESEPLKPPDCAVPVEAPRQAPASPYVQVGENGIDDVGEVEGRMQPYAKLGCTTSLPLRVVSSSQGPPQRAESTASGYTPFPSLLSMSKPRESAPKACAKAECSTAPWRKDDTAGQSQPEQPYTRVGFDACAFEGAPSEGRSHLDSYTILNTSLGDVNDALPGVHCAPPYVKATQEPSRAPHHGDPSQVKSDAPAPAYCKVGAPTASRDCADCGASEDSETCAKRPAVAVPSSIAEGCFDVAALAPLECLEGSGGVGDREEPAAEWDLCAEEAADLLSAEYSGPARESMSAKPTLRSGGYTSWEVLAKRRDCDADAFARAVKNA